MAMHVMRNILTSQLRKNMTKSRSYSLWTPDYLETMKPKIPLYPVLLIQVKGYAYPVLESYQKFVHRLAQNMDFDIENSYAMPSKVIKIQKFKPQSNALDTEYKYEIYERDIQISNVTSVKLPILMRMLEAALPEGVTLTVEEMTPQKEEFRYVPDKELIDLKAELNEMQKKK